MESGWQPGLNILLVEDSDEDAELILSEIRRHGYAVESARVENAEDNLYRELTQLAPDQADRIVFVTGGASTPAARALLDQVSNPRIEKPIEPRNLRLMVVTLLVR